MTPAEEQIVSETGKALTKYSEAHAHEVGLPSPQAVNFMFSVANMLYSSALVGKDMGLSKDQVNRLREFGITGEELEKRDRAAVIANGMGKMLVGRELGIEPMAAWLDIDLVKTKIFVRYPQLHRLIEEKGWTIEEIERSETRAAIRLTHPRKPTRDFEFTFEDAKRAGLTKRGGYNGDSPSQYELRPRVMLWARVISEAYRGTGGKGSVYTTEEKYEVLASDSDAQEQQVAPEPRLKVGRKPKQTPTVASDTVGGDGMTSTNVAEAAEEASPRDEIQTSDKPPFDPTPKTQPINPTARANDYLRGFLGVTKLPKHHPHINAALFYFTSMEALRLLPDPYAVGVDLHDYLTGDPIHIEKMTPEDLIAFMRVLARLESDFTLATGLRDNAMEPGQIAKTIAEWEESGMDLATCSADDIESAVFLLGPREYGENLFSKNRG